MLYEIEYHFKLDFSHLYRIETVLLEDWWNNLMGGINCRTLILEYFISKMYLLKTFSLSCC